MQQRPGSRRFQDNVDGICNAGRSRDSCRHFDRPNSAGIEIRTLNPEGRGSSSMQFTTGPASMRTRRTSHCAIAWLSVIVTTALVVLVPGCGEVSPPTASQSQTAHLTAVRWRVCRRVACSSRQQKRHGVRVPACRAGVAEHRLGGFAFIRACTGDGCCVKRSDGPYN